MSEPLPPRHSARETRLLLLTLAVSVAALLLLARFRFPERPLTDLSTPQPLTRLTRVTAFDELSAMLRDLLRQFEGAVVPARIFVAAAGGGGAAGSARAAETPRDALGLLVRDDLALVPLPPGGRVEAVAGSPLTANGVVARDEQRGLAVVRVPGYTAAEISVQPPATPLDAPGYVAVLEAAPDGPTIRAEFVSRYTTEPNASWDQPVLVLSGPTTAKPGSLIFTLSGRLVGMTLADSGRLLVVPAPALMARATRLANGETVVVVESGIDVQPLTPAIAKATGATEGVVVSAISSEGGADLALGDVISLAAGRPVRTPRDWQQILRSQTPGAAIKLSIVRFGKPLEASLTLPRNAGAPSSNAGSGAAGASTSATTAAAAAASPLDAMGLTLRGVNGDSEVIAVRPASPAARSGLRPGDRVTSLPGLPGRAAPAASASASPHAIATACAELASGQALLLAIERDGAARIAALEKP